MAGLESEMDRKWILLFLAWLIATTSTLGSLFFSEVMEFPPCSLCWYQRIFMFPLVIVLGAGLLPFEPTVIRYSVPLALLGGIIAVYHNLLYAGILPENVAPCTQGVSCTENHIEIFGFLSIPMLALMAFVAIAVLLFMIKKEKSE